MRCKNTDFLHQKKNKKEKFWEGILAWVCVCAWKVRGDITMEKGRKFMVVQQCEPVNTTNRQNEDIIF